MSRHSVRLLVLVYNIIFIIGRCDALRCRTDEGPSEFELKRVTRNCMRKFDDSFSNDSKEQDPQLTQQQQQQQWYSDNRYRHNSNSSNSKWPLLERHYDDSYYNDHSYGSNLGNIDKSQDTYNPYNRNMNHDRSNNGRDTWNGDYDRMYRTNSQYDYMNSQPYQRNGDNLNHNSSFNNDYNSYDSNQSRRRTNQNDNRSNSNNRYNISREQKSYNSSADRNKNQTDQQKLCVVHCFFEQLNMLNGNDYPDRYKVTYILTRDIHDRELRSFFVDTIQECFRYLESQRRTDKCQFSRDLVNCMTEYAQAYCEDWNEFHVIFN